MQFNFGSVNLNVLEFQSKVGKEFFLKKFTQMNQIANIFEIKEETVELDYSKIDKAIDFTCAILK